MINFWMSRSNENICDDNFSRLGIGYIYECLLDVYPRIEFNSTKVVDVNLLVKGFAI